MTRWEEEVEDIAGVFVGIGMFVMIIYLVRILGDNKRRNRLAQMRFDLQNKLLEKFGTSQELLEYLRSDAGLRFLDFVPVEKASPYGRILGSVQWGIVLLTAGAASLFLRHQIPDGFEEFTVFGAFGVALGAGFLVSAVVAYVLSKSWGVINGEQPSLPEKV
jgi:hypothetical protein